MAQGSHQARARTRSDNLPIFEYMSYGAVRLMTRCKDWDSHALQRPCCAGNRWTDRELILIKKGKTNHDYLYELQGAFKSNFSELSIIFDYTWYGHFEANKELVTKAKEYLAEIQRREQAA